MWKVDNFFWKTYSIVYDFHRFVSPYKELLNDVEQALDIEYQNKVLDAGCGTGNFLSKLVKKNVEAVFTGIDISQSMLSQAQKKLGRYKTNLLIGDLNKKLIFPDNYFDRILSVHTLYATKDPQFTISELLRVLKFGGTLIIVNPQPDVKMSTMYFGMIRASKGLEKLLVFCITVPLFFFNMIIKMKANNSDYHFLPKSSWIKMINKFGVKMVDVEQVYIKSYLVKVIK